MVARRLIQIRQQINFIKFKQLSMHLNSMISKIIDFFFCWTLNEKKKEKEERKKTETKLKKKNDSIEL